MADNPKPPSLGFGLNPLQTAALKVGRIGLKVWVIIGGVIIAARFFAGEVSIWPQMFFFQIAAFGAVLVGGSLVVFSGAVWRGLWGFVRGLRAPALPKAKPHGFTSEETRRDDANDFDPSIFEDDAPQGGDRNFKEAFGEKRTQGRESIERRREKLLAIMDDANAGKNIKEAAQNKLKSLPPPPKQITKQRLNKG